MLGELSRWAERVYSESDMGRSLATSLSGVVGLAVYLRVHDGVVAALSVIIVFPLARVAAQWLQVRVTRRTERRHQREKARELFERLSENERAIVEAFVAEGGTVLTWTQVNRLGLPGPAFESLMARGLIAASVTADGLRETFVLDTDVFDAARAAGQLVAKRVDETES